MDRHLLFRSPRPGSRAPSAGQTIRKTCGRQSTKLWVLTARSPRWPAATGRALNQTQKHPPAGPPRQRQLMLRGDWLPRRRPRQPQRSQHPPVQRRQASGPLPRALQLGRASPPGALPHRPPDFPKGGTFRVHLPPVTSQLRLNQLPALPRLNQQQPLRQSIRRRFFRQNRQQAPPPRRQPKRRRQPTLWRLPRQHALRQPLPRPPQPRPPRPRCLRSSPVPTTALKVTTRTPMTTGVRPGTKTLPRWMKSLPWTGTLRRARRPGPPGLAGLVNTGLETPGQPVRLARRPLENCRAASPEPGQTPGPRRAPDPFPPGPHRLEIHRTTPGPVLWSRHRASGLSVRTAT